MAYRQPRCEVHAVRYRLYCTIEIAIDSRRFDGRCASIAFPLIRTLSTVTCFLGYFVCRLCIIQTQALNAACLLFRLCRLTHSRLFSVTACFCQCLHTHAVIWDENTRARLLTRETHAYAYVSTDSPRWPHTTSYITRPRTDHASKYKLTRIFRTRGKKQKKKICHYFARSSR